MRIKLVLDKWSLCGGCVYQETQEKCPQCERNPGLSKLKDMHTTKEQLEKKAKKEAEDLCKEIEDATGGNPVERRNQSFLGAWGVQPNPQGPPDKEGDDSG